MILEEAQTNLAATIEGLKASHKDCQTRLDEMQTKIEQIDQALKLATQLQQALQSIEP